MRTPYAHDVAQRGLREGHASDLVAAEGLEVRAEQDDERRDGTDDESIEVDAERLHEPLLDRVRDRRGGRGVRGRAFTGLIGKQAALNTLHQCHAKGRAGDLAEAEGRLDDVEEHCRHFTDVDDDDHETHGEVCQRHEGHDDLRDVGNALHATDDDETRDKCNGQTDDGLKCRGVLVEGGREGLRNSVGLECFVEPAEGNGDGHGEDRRQLLPAQAAAHVVRRATAVGIPVADLPQLSERRLDEGRRATEDGNHPHPEHRARSTDGNRDGHAGDVAGTHARRRGNGERLKRGDAAVFLVLVGAHALGALDDGLEHIGNHTDLHDGSPETKEETCGDEQPRKDPCPQSVVNRTEHGAENFLHAENNRVCEPDLPISCGRRHLTLPYFWQFGQ